MTLPTCDLARWFPPGQYPNYVADVVRELQNQPDMLLEVRWDDAIARLAHAKVHPGLTGSIVAELDYAIPDGAAVLQIRSISIGNLPNDHHEWTSIEDDRGGIAYGRVLVESTLTAQQDSLSVEVPKVEVAPAAVAATAKFAVPVAAMAARSEDGRFVRILPWIACCLVAAVGGLWLAQRARAGRKNDADRLPSTRQ